MFKRYPTPQTVWMSCGFEGGVLQLVAQAVAAHGDGDIVAHGLKAPDKLIKILAGKDLIRVPREEEKKLKLLVCEGDGLPVHGDSARRGWPHCRRGWRSAGFSGRATCRR